MLPLERMLQLESMLQLERMLHFLLYRLVVDRHHVDADPDPIFYFDSDPVPDPVPTLQWKIKNCFKLIFLQIVYIVLSFSVVLSSYFSIFMTVRYGILKFS
jgi:hypothetical protein